MHKDFLALVCDWCLQADIQQLASYRMYKRLQVLKIKIKEWKQNVFVKIDTSRYVLSNEVEVQGRKEESRLLLSEVIEARKERMHKILDLNHMQGNALATKLKNHYGSKVGIKHQFLSQGGECEKQGELCRENLEGRESVW